MTQEQIEFLTETNVYIKNVLEPLAAVCEEIDNRVNEALAYDEQTLIDAGVIFVHVVSNISIRKGILDEEKADDFAVRFRQLIIDMTGIDPQKVNRDNSDNKNDEKGRNNHQH
jgi:hypothetical protein